MEQRNNNFDLLRLFAAVLVIISHCFGGINKGNEQPLLIINNIQFIPSSIGLFIFFVISGYLVMQSLGRSSSALNYLMKRALRIFPALIVCNILCIFILGLFFSSLDLKSFIAEKSTWKYLWCNTFFLGHQADLPGVFNTLKTDKNVNASIWTLSIEIGLYILLLIGWILKALKSKMFLGITFLLFLIATCFLHNKSFGNFPSEFYINFSLYFFEGVMLYIFASSHLWKWYWPILLLPFYFLFTDTWIKWLTITLIGSYVLLNFANLSRLISFKKIDISYGLYIYAFPVQQCILSIVGYTINPWLFCLLTTLVTLPIAFASWKLIEQPFLRFKRN